MTGPLSLNITFYVRVLGRGVGVNDHSQAANT